METGLLQPEEEQLMPEETEQPMPEAEQPTAEGGNPQDMEIADMFIANGLRLIHNKDVSDGFIRRVKKAKDPIAAIADSTLDIVARVEQSAESKGVQLPLEMVGQVGNIFMGEIIRVVEAAGVKKLTDDNKYLAFSLAVSKYLDRAVKSGKISEEQLQQLAEQAKQSPQGQAMMSGQPQEQATAGEPPMEGGV